MKLVVLAPSNGSSIDVGRAGVATLGVHPGLFFILLCGQGSYLIYTNNLGVLIVLMRWQFTPGTAQTERIMTTFVHDKESEKESATHF